MDPKIKQQYDDICRELNMDKDTERKSWNIYTEISRNFTLDGEQNHWLCCALYATCRESFTPTVGGADSVVKGNCISLTKLLRSCNISIYEFFIKIKKWIEFVSLPISFSNQIDRLERSFSVSYLLYQKYKETFEQIFILTSAEKRNKKSKLGRCSTKRLYDFCWSLFLCSKGEEPTYTIEIVTSFHLLLCCFDVVFNSVLFEQKFDLINTSFLDVSRKLNEPDFDVKQFEILKLLCQKHDSSFEEVNDMKQKSFKKIFEKFITTKVLKSEKEEFYDLISLNNFDFNLRSLNMTYDQYVLSVGEFDERIFLNNTMLNENQSEVEAEKQRQFNSTLKSLTPGTPLTRKHHLPNKDVTNKEPISSATQNVRKLQGIADRSLSPEFASLIEESTQKRIDEILDNLCNTFCEKYPTKPEAKKRFTLAKSLYFYLLEKIVMGEMKTKPTLHLKVLLKTDIMHTILVACCVEIVIAAYSSNQIKFPWVLECFNIHPFHFYRIIEMVVMRQDDILTRMLIKHLNTIEEKCIDSLVWVDSSILWESLKQLDTFPSWAAVESKNNSNQQIMKKPDDGTLEKISNQILFSPINSACDNFDPSVSGESARRNLFSEGKGNEIISDQTNKIEEKKKGAGSLLLFCRKFYKLAFLRISELCKELELRSDEILRQIWTLFEYSITYKTELMKDRHLDQILMCAIYVFIKVKDIQGKTFTDIMKFYRLQPQAASYIYREVLIKAAVKNDRGEITTPAVYDDIIYFYNNVYVQKMTPYALQFGDKSKSPRKLLLSPCPPDKLLSPRKISHSHLLYVQQLEKPVNIPQSPNSITYEFNKSPAKNLEEMNLRINAGKRNLPFDEDDKEGAVIKIKRNSTAPYMTRKIHNFILQRQDGL